MAVEEDTGAPLLADPGPRSKTFPREAKERDRARIPREGSPRPGPTRQP